MPELRRSSERCRLSLKGETLEYLLKRSNARRTLTLSVHASGALTVNAPWRLSLPDVERFILHKSTWVRTKLDAAKSAPAPIREWQEGMTLPYLGEPLQLRILGYPAPARVADQQLWLAVNAGATVQTAVLGWYRSAALADFQMRLQHFMPLLQRRPGNLLLSNARTRWGSCTRDGVVRVNWRLIQAPAAQIDYVMAHELAHLAHLNHSPAFWREVARLSPEFASARASLRENSADYQRI